MQMVGLDSCHCDIDQTQPEINLDMKHIVYVAEVDEGVKKKYNSMYGSKLVTPDEKKLDSLICN